MDTWDMDSQAGTRGRVIKAWEALGDWTIANFPGARGTLLRDSERPNVFISFGPWKDAAAATAWREAEGFRARLAVVQETLERFEPRLLELVATKG